MLRIRARLCVWLEDVPPVGGALCEAHIRLLAEAGSGPPYRREALGAVPAEVSGCAHFGCLEQVVPPGSEHDEPEH